MKNLKGFLEYGVIKSKRDIEKSQELLKIYESLLSETNSGKLTERDVAMAFKNTKKGYSFYKDIVSAYRVYNLLLKK